MLLKYKELSTKDNKWLLRHVSVFPPNIKQTLNIKHVQHYTKHVQYMYIHFNNNETNQEHRIQIDGF